MKVYSKLRLHALFGVSRGTLERYVDWDNITHYPETAKNPKYSPYDVGEYLGYSHEQVEQILKKEKEV